MEKYSESFPLRITTKMYRWLKVEAACEYLSISQFLRKLIREAMEKK